MVEGSEAGIGAKFLRNRTFMTSSGFGMLTLLSRFLKDQTAATSIEYAIIAAGLSILIVVAVNGIGTTLSGRFTSVNNSLK
jgi:pilus assembly protein Flp/PilA